MKKGNCLNGGLFIAYVGVEWLLHGEERNKDFPVDRKMVEWLKDHPEIREQIWKMMKDRKNV